MMLFWAKWEKKTLTGYFFFSDSNSMNTTVLFIVICADVHHTECVCVYRIEDHCLPFMSTTRGHMHITIYMHILIVKVRIGKIPLTVSPNFSPAPSSMAERGVFEPPRPLLPFSNAGPWSWFLVRAAVHVRGGWKNLLPLDPIAAYAAFDGPRLSRRRISAFRGFFSFWMLIRNFDGGFEVDLGSGSIFEDFLRGSGGSWTILNDFLEVLGIQISWGSQGTSWR